MCYLAQQTTMDVLVLKLTMANRKAMNN
jgi:hypothetical protein